MDGKHAPVDHGRARQQIKRLVARIKHPHAPVEADALVVEPVSQRQLPRLVVPAEQVEVPVLQLVQDEQEELENTYEWYSYYRNLESHVQLCTGDLLVYRIYYHEYTGGAHGNYMTSFLNIDLNTLMPVHLSDLFVEDFKEPLTELLWQQLMTDNKVASRQEIEDLGYGSTGELEPTENFYLTSKGITFYYNIYEIAPYVMGPTQITLSFESIQHLLDGNSEVLKNLN